MQLAESSQESSSELPFVVLLGMEHEKGMGNIGSGVIVGPRTVLTAAHCWDEEEQGTAGAKTFVLAGRHMGGDWVRIVTSHFVLIILINFVLTRGISH